MSRGKRRKDQVIEGGKSVGDTPREKTNGGRKEREKEGRNVGGRGRGEGESINKVQRNLLSFA